ncbi:MAG: DJ-1/PfpI family protein, partial [Actinobacteria bacterium]|nr:DJ-1/PfpI family protein [Actinomycetota bacterium]
GATVDIASIKKGLLKGAHGKAVIEVTFTLDEVDTLEYNALVIPGGKGISAITEHPLAQKLVKDFFESGKPIGAIGNGPLMLIDAGVVSGIALTGWRKIKKELESAGAKFLKEDVWTYENIISAREAKYSDRFVGSIEAALL